MAKAIEQLKSGLTVGHAALGFRGGLWGSVRVRGGTLLPRFDAAAQMPPPYPVVFCVAFGKEVISHRFSTEDDLYSMW